MGVRYFFVKTSLYVLLKDFAGCSAWLKIVNKESMIKKPVIIREFIQLVFNWDSAGFPIKEYI